MYKKIAVVCVNPWEKFLPDHSQGNARYYYEWLHEEALLRNIDHDCKEQIELYGDFREQERKSKFLESIEIPQIIYLQGKQNALIASVLDFADVVIVGMPRNRKECDEVFLSVLPWKEKSLFLWDGRLGRENSFFRKIQREYQLCDNQMIELKKLPFS